MKLFWPSGFARFEVFYTQNLTSVPGVQSTFEAVEKGPSQQERSCCEKHDVERLLSMVEF